MTAIGIGIVGGGYMGKAHSVAMAAVGAVFETRLRPRLEMICASSAQSAEHYRQAFGFERGTDDWRILVDDPRVEAVVIATPQSFAIATSRRPPSSGASPCSVKSRWGANLADSRAMVAAAEASGLCQYGWVQLHPHARQPIRAATCGFWRDWRGHVVSR